MRTGLRNDAWPTMWISSSRLVNDFVHAIDSFKIKNVFFGSAIKNFNQLWFNFWANENLTSSMILKTKTEKPAVHLWTECDQI